MSSKRVLTTNKFGCTPIKERTFNKLDPPDFFVSESQTSMSPMASALARPKTSRGRSSFLIVLSFSEYTDFCMLGVQNPSPERFTDYVVTAEHSVGDDDVNYVKSRAKSDDTLIQERVLVHEYADTALHAYTAKQKLTLYAIFLLGSAL
jgi:hypothetical protein